MIMPYWMHWFWITFFVISSIQVSNSYPSYNSTYNKSTTLDDSIILSTSTIKYNDDELLHSNATTTTNQQQQKNRSTSVIINNNETTVKETRTPKAIDTTIPKQLHQITMTNPGNSSTVKSNVTKVLLHESMVVADQNATGSIQHEDIRMLNHFNHSELIESLLPNSTFGIADGNKTLNDTVYHDEIIASNTTDPLTLSLANDQKRKELIIDDIDVTPTDEINVQEKVGASTDIIESRENPNSIFTVATITGASFGVLIFGVLIGAISFVLYRRRYLNKPQSLNDKSSNLDSSGYIDDSTMRENSEEMYSLDNDSFLNSLEAMTIQNYWTDNVKHTKL
ncbi:uncharacterized protein LOC123302690 [Chrysoperla carnea]|uniref:uncharacterized protein LOC123302690 n=1 Tax=Chrysoperla carnea TaxID=189513 RepID=UPI001D063433|nr:uncharacterized protein LOC123302690 [Chrysoperla carnea]